MKTSTKYSVSDAATLYKKSRATLYKDIKNGVLSRDHDGSIDFSELLRVYGEPSRNVNSSQTTETRKLSEVHLLEQQVYMLQKQLEQAHEREQFQREELKAKNGQLHVKDEQIEAIQRLLEAPKAYTTSSIDPKLDIATDTRSKSKSNYDVLTTQPRETPVEVEIQTQPKDDGLTTPEQMENKRIPVPEHIEPEPEKRGFWSRFFRPYD
jgi:hypothetical protein